MDVILERLFQYELEMGALGAIAVMIVALIIHLGHCDIEHPLCLLDLLADLGEIGDLEWSSVLLDDVHQVDAIPGKGVVLLNGELLLRPVKCLIY